MPTYPSLFRFNRFPPVTHILCSNNRFVNGPWPYDLVIALDDLDTWWGNDPYCLRRLAVIGWWEIN
jgi:hypothetical protein